MHRFHKTSVFVLNYRVYFEFQTNLSPKMLDMSIWLFE